MTRSRFLYILSAFSVVTLSFVVNHYISSLSPLFISLIAGLLVGNIFSLSSESNIASTYLSKSGMRIGISLLGLQITFQNFADIGLKGFLVILVIVTTTFTMTRSLGVRFGFTPELSLLMASGFSICGASAVAAVGAARKNRKDEIAYAIGLVTLLGTLSIFVIPPITRVLSLSASTSGAWIGAAVHDIGQVIATASIVGPSSLKFAVITKLARVVLLAPLLVALSSGAKSSSSKPTSRMPRISSYLPPFIVIFLLLVAINNFINVSPPFQGFLANLSKFLLSAGLFSMASTVRLIELRKIGGKPLIFGLASWLFFGALSLILIRLAGI